MTSEYRCFKQTCLAAGQRQVSTLPTLRAKSETSLDQHVFQKPFHNCPRGKRKPLGWEDVEQAAGSTATASSPGFSERPGGHSPAASRGVPSLSRDSQGMPRHSFMKQLLRDSSRAPRCPSGTAALGYSIAPPSNSGAKLQHLKLRG